MAQVGVIPALRRSPWTEFVGGSTHSADTANRVLTTDERHYADLDALLDDPTVDALYLPLPNDLHAPTIEAALRAGKHVLCEKPLLLEMSDYDILDRELDMAGVLVAEAFMSSYHPRLRDVLSHVASGAYGEVISVDTTFTGTLNPLSGYRLDANRGGGSLFDVGIYALHPIVSLLGNEPLHIATAASISGDDPPVDLTLGALLAYDGGAMASFTTSFVAGESQQLRILTNRALIEVDHACTPTLQDTTWRSAETSREPIDHYCEPSDPYQAMVDEVFSSFSRGVEPSWDLAHSRNLAKLLFRLSQAWQTTIAGHPPR